MTTAGFRFSNGNLEKLLALPKYLLSLVLSWFVPRIAAAWVFGSGIGVGEGALALARQLKREQPHASITWIVADEAEAEAARAEGFEAVLRRGWAGFWVTLRAGQIIVTHGLGDVNRFGVFGGFIVQLWHGAPLKKLHLDSSVTTTVRGPAMIQGLLRRMYVAGAGEIDLFVAGSVTSAERLRSAFRVAPGKVRVLGDPRDDALAAQAVDADAAAAARQVILEKLGLTRLEGTESEPARLVLYAPTWRDGEADPAEPTAEEAALIQDALERLGAQLIVRSHPLGRGAYETLLGERVHLLGSDLVEDITPVLGAFDTVITDYSSIALDFSLLSRPIVWFAPDLEQYTATRGLYEPLEVTADGRVDHTWAEVIARLTKQAENPAEQREAKYAAQRLARRFHEYPEGGAAARVLDEVRRLRTPVRELIAPDAVFFESFYGRQVACNPLALDREIAQRFPEMARYWSVTNERQVVPEGATALLVGGREWFAARRIARLVVVNDWLRYGFRRRAGQTVLQTWHGTMLKHLALGRPSVSLRTRLAIRRESRRWSMMLSQNAHSTEQFRKSYAFRGEILESGYPRDDRLARAVIGEGALTPIAVRGARADLGIAQGGRVISYVPTWRDGGVALVDDIDVHALADELGDEWTVVVRGHSRTQAFGSYFGPNNVVDASLHPDVNDVILASDIVITDYSSVMFDAAVAQRPMLFFVPDIVSYRDRERGFTFDFEATAPGPLLSDREALVACVREFGSRGDDAQWVKESAEAAAAWRERFVPHDDGLASARVVDALVARGALG